jgi:hypothetical protein
MMWQMLKEIGFCVVSLVAAGTIFAQAPPGPLPPPAVTVSGADRPMKPPPPPKPRTSIMGAWKLNHDDSDDPGQKMRQAKNNGRGNNGSSGPHVGMGIPGVGMGGGGRQRPTNAESDADREHLQELLSPSRELTLAQKEPKDPEIDVSDDRDRKLSLFTDGRKLEKSKSESYQQVAAHWDDSRLVTDEKTARGAKMSRTFELSSDGMQLWETVKLTTGKKDYPVTIRYVYDQLNERVAAADPDAPVLKRAPAGKTTEQ